MTDVGALWSTYPVEGQPRPLTIRSVSSTLARFWTDRGVRQLPAHLLTVTGLRAPYYAAVLSGLPNTRGLAVRLERSRDAVTSAVVGDGLASRTVVSLLARRLPVWAAD